jgi:arylsulfatase A-like enzyme
MKQEFSPLPEISGNTCPIGKMEGHYLAAIPYMISCFPIIPLLTVLGAILPARGADPVPQRPNVLVVLLDDLGYSDLGCYGGEMSTPNIDALAKGGLRFTHMVNSARCCPTRASLLTGLHPAQAGIPNFSGQLSQNTATLAEVMKGAGYKTYAVGKWHVGNSPAASPVARGFDEFYGYTNGHSAGLWNPGNYRRLPEDREPELKYAPGKFYATDVFTDYTVEFIKQAGKEKKPWFVYLAHSAPHFPIQAPEASAQPFVETYRKGWDELRAKRFQRMKDIGLIDSDAWKLSPLSLVPVAKTEALSNGYGGKPNPDWKSLDAPRREDLAHRMALYAAMIKHVDEGMGKIVKQLKESGSYDNTLILLLSDNGACYEWGPFGFDGPSGAGKNTLHEGEAIRSMGAPKDHLSYGSGWANLSNTPFRLYKHFTHEGGIISPFIVHWPKGIAKADRWVRDPVQIIDLMPTLVDAGSASYPEQRDGKKVPPQEGVSLLPTFSGSALPERSLFVQHEGAFMIRKGQWKLVKGKRFPTEAKWELYDIKADPCEMNDLAAKQPERVTALSREWEQWAERTGTPGTATPKSKAKRNKKNRENAQ